MKSFSQIGLIQVFILTIILSFQVTQAQLTGAWQDDNGTSYCIRQTGDRLFWYMDDRPRVHNVFYGIIAGGYITGNWADLPGGQKNGNGGLSLRIESNNRFVKIGETQNYLGSNWTRLDNSNCDEDCMKYDLSGIWYDYTQATGNKGGESRITQNGDNLTFTNEFNMSSSGSCVNETTIIANDWEGGLRARITNNGQRIEWSNGSVWQRTKR